MKFYRIKFTSWRDRAAAQRTTKETTALAELSAEVSRREREIDLERRKDKPDAALVTVLAGAREQLASQLRAAADEEGQKAAATERAAELHPKAGTIGYQVVDERRMVVERMVDADGNDLPASAVFEYEIEQVDAPAPAWAEAKLAEWGAEKDAGIARLMRGG